jgi:hypothetical protein
MRNNGQLGFAAILMVAVLVTIGVAGTGYLVYNAHNKKSLVSSDTTTSGTTPAEKTRSTSAGTAATVTPQGTYLDFKDVGVKMLLSSSVSDAVYAPYHNPNSEGATVYGISTQSIINASSDVGCTAASGPLGIVSVNSTAPKQLDGSGGFKQLTPDNKTLFLIGGKYYQYMAPQNIGCSGGQVTDAQIQAAQKAFEQSFASLQPDTAN